jgi:hypothetical protein
VDIVHVTDASVCGCCQAVRAAVRLLHSLNIPQMCLLLRLRLVRHLGRFQAEADTVGAKAGCCGCARHGSMVLYNS